MKKLRARGTQNALDGCENKKKFDRTSEIDGRDSENRKNTIKMNENSSAHGSKKMGSYNFQETRLCLSIE